MSVNLFKEEEHPRDKDGKFKEKGAADKAESKKEGSAPAKELTSVSNGEVSTTYAPANYTKQQAEEVYKNFEAKTKEAKKKEFKTETTDINLTMSKEIKKVTPEKIAEVKAEVNEKGEKTYNDVYVDAAAKLIQSYEELADKVGNELVDIVENLGGVMVGLDFRIKSLSSLSRKFDAEHAEKLAKGKDLTPDEIAANMKDVIRYTGCFTHESFQDSVDKVVMALKQKGYTCTKFASSFSDRDDEGNEREYKGLNCNFRNAEGKVFELQFHTPESIEKKEKFSVDIANKKAFAKNWEVSSHSFYERNRDLQAKIDKKTATQDEVNEMAILKDKSRSIWRGTPNYSWDKDKYLDKPPMYSHSK